MDARGHGSSAAAHATDGRRLQCCPHDRYACCLRTVGSSCCRRVKIKLCSVRCVCVASVLVAMAARVMGGVLGAAGAPSASLLQRSERQGGLTKLRSHYSGICRFVRHLRLHQLGRMHRAREARAIQRTGAGADQEKGTGAASRDQETGPGPAHRRRRLADSPV